MEYSVNKNIVLSVHNEELVLLNMKDGMFYGIDEIGHYIWSFMEKKVELDSITKFISEKYSISEEQAHKDIMEFVNQLSIYKLVKLK